MLGDVISLVLLRLVPPPPQNLVPTVRSLLFPFKRLLRQTLIKLERWTDAVEFCDRALHVDGNCVKALSRRASALVELAGDYVTPTAGTADIPPGNGESTAPSVLLYHSVDVKNKRAPFINTRTV